MYNILLHALKQTKCKNNFTGRFSGRVLDFHVLGEFASLNFFFFNFYIHLYYENSKNIFKMPIIKLYFKFNFYIK